MASPSPASTSRIASLLNLLPRATGKPVHVMGNDFPNAVGLADGLDKDGAHINALAALHAAGAIRILKSNTRCCTKYGVVMGLSMDMGGV